MGRTDGGDAPALLEYRRARSARRVWLPRPAEGAVGGAVACLALVAMTAYLAFRAGVAYTGHVDEALIVTAPIVCGVIALLAIVYFRFRTVSSVVGALVGVMLAAATATGGFFVGDAFNSRDDRLLFIAPIAFAAPLAVAAYALWLKHRWGGFPLGVVFGIVSGTAACAVLAPMGLLLVALRSV